MNSSSLAAALLLLAAATPSGGQPVAPATPGRTADLESRAKAFVRQLEKEDFRAAVREFDEAMNKALPGDALEKLWKQVVKQVGALREVRGVRSEKIRTFDIVFVACHFEKANLDVKVVFNPEKQVTGLSFVSPKPPVPPKTPPYARPDAYAESEVVVVSGEYRLPGTLTVPKGDGPFPAVVLIHGSGPNDRDETVGPNKPFRDLAWGLAAQGVAVLRFDKRTHAYGPKLVKEKITLKEEVLDDAVAAAAFLRKQAKIDPKKVFLLGHSLGAVAGPQVGGRDPDLAGLILLAGCTRPLEDVILDQVTYLLSLQPPSEEGKKELEKLKKQVAKVKDPGLSPDTPGEELPLGGVPGAYWLSLRGYDPAATAARLSMPVLVLWGERDYQVTGDDFAGWKKALEGRPRARLKSYPKLNHLFMEGEGKAKPAEYMEKAGNVAAEVIDDVAAWIKGR
jgi:dienelactone hydrolase